MVASAPRTDIRVIRFVRRLEPRTSVTADIVGATGRYCERIGVPRPSYEQIRLMVRTAHDRRGRRRAAIELALDVELRAGPPSDLLYLLGDARRAPRARR